MVKGKRRNLNLALHNLMFDPISDGAAKSLSALTKHGDFLGTAKKYFCLNELTTSITFV
jgi:hypothetical protein